MRDLGFKDNDLLIASTEGGETPWVIGATEYAEKMSKRSPWILYGNPDEILVKTVERSKRVIENKRINKINLNVGSMGVTGSTRMQSTTILMYAIGLALLKYYKLKLISKEEMDKQFLEMCKKEVGSFKEYFENLKEDDFLYDFTMKES